MSRSDVKGRKAAADKKKARQTGDAPSNKNVWQLLRWTFIVAKATGRKAAPMLGFATLQCTNIKT